jgi:hypothetical protein
MSNPWDFDAGACGPERRPLPHRDRDHSLCAVTMAWAAPADRPRRCRRGPRSLRSEAGAGCLATTMDAPLGRKPCRRLQILERIGWDQKERPR